MITSALIFVDQISSDDRKPRSLLLAGGLSVIERQLRQLKNLGIKKVCILSFSMREILQEALRHAKAIPSDIEILSSHEFHPEALCKPEEKLLLIEEGVILDKRILSASIGTSSTHERRLAVFPGNAVVIGKGLGLKLQAAQQDYLFASAACVCGYDVKRAFADTEFIKSPLKSVLKAAILSGPVELVDVTELPTYIPDRRRNVDILWRPVTTHEESRKATAAIIEATQKGVLDWPAKYIHPYIEDVLVRLLCPLSVTPNMITVFTAFGGIAVAWLFVSGYLGFGLLGALLIGILDGVDGKLARTKLESTRIGELEHLLDKIIEYSWYFAIAWHLAHSHNDGPMWVLVAFIISLFSVAEAVQGEFFRRMTGRQLDDAGSFERTFRLIGARRNTQFWLLVPFGLYHAWDIGFIILSFYTVVTFFITQARFMLRTREYVSEQSHVIKKNFEDSTYF